MKKLIIAALVAFLMGLPLIADSDQASLDEAQSPAVPQWTADDTIALVEAKSAQYGVSRETLLSVIRCETANQIASTTIQSGYYRAGVRERSFGLAQINLPSNPETSYDEATDPHYAVDFLARGIKTGHGALWTCYRSLYHSDSKS